MQMKFKLTYKLTVLVWITGDPFNRQICLTHFLWRFQMSTNKILIHLDDRQIHLSCCSMARSTFEDRSFGQVQHF